jgi:tryptophan synthase alpha chain
MSRIDDIFSDHRAAGRTALMPFLTAGYPSLDVTGQTIPALAEAGASIAELGIPFSDPIADGPVIAESMHKALLGGVTPSGVFEIVRCMRKKTSMGLIAMVSHSIVDRMGAGRFIGEAAEAGFDGLIIPDIDLEAAREVKMRADDRDMSFSLLVAPTTGGRRLEQVVSLCTGFVYVLARVGITGERDAAPEVTRRVEALRRITDLPLAVGFGISTPDHVRAVTESADAAIVGSALVRRMGQADDPLASARQFVSDLAAGLARRRH